MSNNRYNTLFVFEGEKTENVIVGKMERHFMGRSFLLFTNHSPLFANCLSSFRNSLSSIILLPPKFKFHNIT